MTKTLHKDLSGLVKVLPDKPGIYQFLDEDARIIYVGKAKSLKKRVASYFNKDRRLSGKVSVMVKKIADIHHMVVDTELDALLLENNLGEGYIRPIVYIGDGEMGLYVKDYPVRVAIACWPWGAYLGEEGLSKGIRVKISSFTRHHVNVFMTKAKICGSYVNSILAKKEVAAMGYDEALLLDTEGYICEASGENIFMVKDNVIKTPPPTAILKGITRDTVITIANDKGIKVVEQRFTRDELYVADEAFFTGTAAEVTPIREVDDRKIGEGRRGPITEKIQSNFFDAVQVK